MEQLKFLYFCSIFLTIDLKFRFFLLPRNLLTTSLKAPQTSFSVISICFLNLPSLKSFLMSVLVKTPSFILVTEKARNLLQMYLRHLPSFERFWQISSSSLLGIQRWYKNFICMYKTFMDHVLDSNEAFFFFWSSFLLNDFLCLFYPIHKNTVKLCAFSFLLGTSILFCNCHS